ncbi:hypothetical protein ACFL4K_02090 [Candidatus Neomarinimicrobiota bacterium]
MTLGITRAAEYQIIKPIAPEERDLSGQDQVQTVGQPLLNPLQAQLIGSDGFHQAGIMVFFRVVSAPKKAKDWELTPVAITDSAGMAQARFRVGDASGVYIIEARLEGGVPDQDEVFYEIVGRGSNWIAKMVMGLLGGLGMFLYGMRIMCSGVYRFLDIDLPPSFCAQILT